MAEQKFERGDLVRVAKDLGPSMAHFTADCDAVVLGSYADQYGGGQEWKSDSYGLLLLEENGRPYRSSSWYKEGQLTMKAISAGLGKIDEHNKAQRRKGLAFV